MIRRTLVATVVVLAVLMPGSVHAADPVDPVRALAESGYPAMSDVAVKLAYARWTPRVDELVQGAPGAMQMGPEWAKGDPHWDAAQAEILKTIGAWAKDLTIAPQAKDLAYQGFARGIDATNAEAMLVSLAADETREFPEFCDRMHLGATFAAERKDLQVGSAEFSKAYGAWLGRLGFTAPAPKSTPAMMKLLESESGRKYATARGFAIDSLLSGIDGQMQLRFSSMQRTFFGSVFAKAQECQNTDHFKK